MTPAAVARPPSRGSALIWSLGFAFLAWIFVCAVADLGHSTDGLRPMMDTARARFPLLVGVVLASVPVGLIVGSIAGARVADRPRLNVARALVAGGSRASSAAGHSANGWSKRVFSAHRRPGTFEGCARRRCAPLRDRDRDRRNVRFTVPARNPRSGIELGMGRLVRSLVVVRRSAHASAALCGSAS